MIHVQIASQVTPQGVSGVRWVLVEALEAADAAPTDQALPAAPSAAAAEPPVAAAAPGAGPVADGLRLGALKGLVVALGLGAALWTAAVQVGPPAKPAAAPAVPGPPAASTPASTLASTPIR